MLNTHMANLLLCVGIISALVATNMGNVGQRFIGHAVNKDFPGQCYYENEKAAFQIGSTYLSTKECAELECQEEYVIRFNVCPLYGLQGPECTKIQDKNAPYPKCCLTFKCPE